MKLLVGNKDRIDFDGPMELSSVQQERFISFLRSRFSVVEIEPANEFRTERLGSRFFMTNWSAKELHQLLDMNLTTEELAPLLGRTWMSVNIMRGKFLSEFLSWAGDVGKDPFKGDTESLIEEFLKTKEEEILKRRKERSERRKQEQERDVLQRELESWQSEKKRTELEWLAKMGKIDAAEIEGYIQLKCALLEKAIAEFDAANDEHY